MLLALGLPIGVVAALVVTRGLASVFYGLSAFEPALLACAVAPVVVSAFAACWLPAQRAARVDPVVALRAE
jgi:putative ABC transport system permease protein